MKEELTRHELFNSPKADTILKDFKREAEENPDSEIQLELVVHPEPAQDGS